MHIRYVHSLQAVSYNINIDYLVTLTLFVTLDEPVGNILIVFSNTSYFIYTSLSMIMEEIL